MTMTVNEALIQLETEIDCSSPSDAYEAAEVLAAEVKRLRIEVIDLRYQVEGFEFWAKAMSTKAAHLHSELEREIYNHGTAVEALRSQLRDR
jgi:hypothetical protein